MNFMYDYHMASETHGDLLLKNVMGEAIMMEYFNAKKCRIQVHILYLNIKTN